MRPETERIQQGRDRPIAELLGATRSGRALEGR